MKKAKVILIALFFIANLFAAYDLRFGDGRIFEFVERLAYAEKIPDKKKNDDKNSGSGGGSIELKGRAIATIDTSCPSKIRIDCLGDQKSLCRPRC